MPLGDITVGLIYAGPDGVFGTADDWEYPSQVTGTDGLYRFSDLPPGTFRVDVDLDTVGNAMSATTSPTVVVTVGPGQEFDDGDVGFAPGEDPLPQTGIDADRLGLAAVMFLVLGLAL
ncbi:MAG: hypothetical protein GWN79_00230, partial [Actinobacteria bacterium]|nr:hypothetical protein [Actinomycetota bacterium]NIS28501.1 hypothetical protein [Actinomycetota bacterium]NIU17616.1 hypothetical protein [Actinomycetota bacterium]NIU63972.1 hypothetical protein [Actinomycetota bacterium]NIV54112.1 hypothetical protein [Actinomycetota bacterium]